MPEPVRGSFVSISQVLDVLVDNGFRHGSGEVRVRARGAHRDDERLTIEPDLERLFRRGDVAGRGRLASDADDLD
jgi:hypothetical protein